MVTAMRYEHPSMPQCPVADMVTQGAYQMTVDQERDVLLKCIDLCTKLTGKKPVGYRAPLYQLRESTVDLLIEHGFEYGKPLS
jgi:peptidoglycan/xylan/chitin deacetylase (PgdA/CDA1 family)